MNNFYWLYLRVSSYSFHLISDAICAFDNKCNPVPVDEVAESNIKFVYSPIKSSRFYEIFLRIAVMVHDYHEICSGPNEMLSGLPHLYLSLLEKSGYKILTIPFNEFSSSEKLLKRVQYLETKLKKIIVK